MFVNDVRQTQQNNKETGDKRRNKEEENKSEEGKVRVPINS